MARCLSVSVLTTLLSLVTLAVLIGWWGMTSWVANVLATAIGTVPSYVLNRRWVWGRHGSVDSTRPLKERAQNGTTSRQTSPEPCRPHTQRRLRT